VGGLIALMGGTWVGGLSAGRDFAPRGFGFAGSAWGKTSTPTFDALAGVAAAA
jgi:hypothetical protein